VADSAGSSPGGLSLPGPAGFPGSPDSPDSPVLGLLATAVSAIGGTERAGQSVMAQAVWDAVTERTHLAVQAGTGTGKSLAYLVPALRLAADKRGPIVVSTATIALQRQIVDRDLPRLAAALREPLGRTPEFAILKGRNNYLCLNKLRNAPEDGQEGLFEPAGPLGAHISRLHQWANSTSTGDRDELVPGVPDPAWRQVAVTAMECIGAQRCPFGVQCFSERARRIAAEADVVVTNHALLAIDALGDGGILPEHRVVIVDEAHELVDRVTSVASGELSVSAVELAVRRCGRLADETLTTRLSEAGNALSPLLVTMPAGRMDRLDPALAASLAVVRDAAMACAVQVRSVANAKSPDTGDNGGGDPAVAGAAQTALVTLEEIGTTADRLLTAFDQEIEEREEVVWLERPEDWADSAARPPSLHVAPLEVGDVLAEHLFAERTVVLTSATLTLGGSFTPLARRWGLDADAVGTEWTGIDVGSPFAHGRSGILYVARHLPPPGRDGLPREYLDELRELIKAAGGRTLGLFSSMRAAKAAAAALREELSYPVLCQGDDSTMQLVKEFAQSEETCLFGTLSLWQGVDVPGPSLRLVVIDRIPFPRPDDPLASARTRAADSRGGSGFMEVSAAHAALLLAQGAGRLLRSMDDRGVVAVLDPRLVTKRYGEYLRASLPPFWQTTDPAVVRAALKRLSAS
jgi:ATP-dependent DNA helicase DinG